MNKANEINKHLERGGVIQVTTYGRATLYTKKNAGDFVLKNDLLHVRYGKNFNCLENTNGLLVRIRFGRVT